MCYKRDSIGFLYKSAGNLLLSIASETLSHEHFDVVVVGAGVVGCAMARRFTLGGAKVAVIEKALDILDGASKANSAILHTAFDAPIDSLEHSCIQNGYLEYQKIHKKLGLPLERVGAYVVAWTREEESKLEAVTQQAHRNGVSDTRLISHKELLQKEPHLAANALAAVEIPGESIIDPWTAPYAYLLQALDNGAKLFRSCHLISADFDGEQWQLSTSQGHLKTTHVINCAGLYGDKLDKAILGKSAFTIHPRKGQFVVFDKTASQLLNGIILPVPSARTKGIVFFRTVFGNLAVGPTAEEQQSRDDASTDEDTLKMLIEAGIKKIPKLASIPVTATYAGIRPATEFKEYQIAPYSDKHWTTVGGIRSTGLSAALGIANHVFDMHQTTHLPCKPLTDPKVPQVQMLAEKEPRDWQRHGYGEIVCHCERVTEREIREALNGKLSAKSLQGLKRKTRVTMGRCQGFYCSTRLAELTAGHFEQPLSEPFNHE